MKFLKHHALKKRYKDEYDHLTSKIIASAMVGLISHANSLDVELNEASRIERETKMKRANLVQDYLDECQKLKIKPSQAFIEKITAK